MSFQSCDIFSLCALEREIRRHKLLDGWYSKQERRGGRDGGEGWLHQGLVWAPRGQTETRLLGNGSLLLCDSDSVVMGGGAEGRHDSKMIPSKYSFILPDEEALSHLPELPEGMLISSGCQTQWWEGFLLPPEPQVNERISEWTLHQVSQWNWMKYISLFSVKLTGYILRYDKTCAIFDESKLCYVAWCWKFKALLWDTPRCIWGLVSGCSPLLCSTLDPQRHNRNGKTEKTATALEYF